MTVHMISVGVTALDFLAHPPDRLFADGGARDAFDEAASVVLADAPAELTGADPGSASRWLSSRLPPGDPDEWLNRAVSLHARPDWPGRFSAEADTLRRTPGRASSAATDAVVLLALPPLRRVQGRDPVPDRAGRMGPVTRPGTPRQRVRPARHSRRRRTADPAAAAPSGS